MIEARMRYMGKRYSLGSYKTAKEVDAAKEAATRVLDRVEADKPAPVKRSPSVPGLATIAQLVGMGIYDRDDEGILNLVRQLMKRHNMVTEGVQNATPPAQTLSMEDLLEVSGGTSVVPQNR